MAGCLERFSCFTTRQHPLSEQMFRMSPAKRGFSHPGGRGADVEDVSSSLLIPWWLHSSGF
eukprot:7550847-Pyramimonas_sp.AAC.1